MVCSAGFSLCLTCATSRSALSRLKAVLQTSMVRSACFSLSRLKAGLQTAVARSAGLSLSRLKAVPQAATVRSAGFSLSRLKAVLQAAAVCSAGFSLSRLKAGLRTAAMPQNPIFLPNIFVPTLLPSSFPSFAKPSQIRGGTQIGVGYLADSGRNTDSKVHSREVLICAPS